MVQAFIAVLAICVLAAMSLQANRRFQGEDRLPMQWSLDGSVNWTASRALALSFTPCLAAVVLAATVALNIVVRPRAGQERLVIPTVIFIAFIFIGAHAPHLRLIGNSLRRNG